MDLDKNIRVIEVQETAGEAEELVVGRLRYPLKDGSKADKGATIYCVHNGEIVRGVVLGYVRMKLEADKGEHDTYQFYMPAHKVRLVGGEEINHAVVFETQEEAERYLEKVGNGISTVFRIEKIDEDIIPPETPVIPGEIPARRNR